MGSWDIWFGQVSSLFESKGSRPNFKSTNMWVHTTVNFQHIPCCDIKYKAVYIYKMWSWVPEASWSFKSGDPDMYFFPCSVNCYCLAFKRVPPHKLRTGKWHADGASTARIWLKHVSWWHCLLFKTIRSYATTTQHICTTLLFTNLMALIQKAASEARKGLALAQGHKSALQDANDSDSVWKQATGCSEVVKYEQEERHGGGRAEAVLQATPPTM